MLPYLFARIYLKPWHNMAVFIGVTDNFSVPVLRIVEKLLFAMVYILVFFAVACCLDKIRIFVWDKLIVKAW